MKEEITLHLNTASLATRIAMTAMTFGLLILCIVISRGSTWWTLVTGLLFLVYFAVCIAATGQRTTRKFKTLGELESWIMRERTREGEL
ncbi:hypothetical protein ACHFCA_34955 (plasmid) [Delftia tsuruhatensis]